MPERGEKVATQKDLEYYLAQFRRIAEHREKGAMRKIWTEYKELLKDLKHFLADYYAEYAIDDELTFEILNGKRQYARFLEEVSEHVRHYMPRIAKETISVVDDTYRIAYDGMVDAVEKSVTTEDLKENLKGVKAATPSQVRAGVLNDLSGITPEMTYTKDAAQFIYDLQRTLNTGLINGDRYSTMAKRVAERCDISYRRSQLIVRTETHRVREKGFLDSGIEINQVLEKGSTPQRITKRWKSMHDEKVRHTKRANHREVDGVTVGIDEEFTLLNGVKAMSPGSSGTAYNDCNCRCILVYELKDITGKAAQKPIDKTAESGIIEAEQVQEIPLEKLKQSGMSTSDFETYSKMIAEHENQDIRNLYSKYADKVDNVKLSKTGAYSDALNTLKFDYIDPRFKELNKYDTLAHEYGHFFDAKAKYSGLNFTEIEKIHDITKLHHFSNVASSSDEFLKAIREDRKYLKSVLNDALKQELEANNASANVQDAINGLFPKSRLKWGHGDPYYNRDYSSVEFMEKRGSNKQLKKQVQQFYKDIGLDASNQAKVKKIMRQYSAASEIWANTMSAIICGGETLDYTKKYLPNSYKAMLEILKKVI